MLVIDRLAEATGCTPAWLSSKLGVEPGADNRAVAEAVLATAARLKELEAAAAPRAALFADAAGILGCEANETAVKGAIMRLTAPNDTRVRACEALDLPTDADDGAMVAAINELRAYRRRTDAEELVDGAVEAGKITPGQRAFWLANAGADIRAARDAINSMR